MRPKTFLSKQISKIFVSEMEQICPSWNSFGKIFLATAVEQLFVTSKLPKLQLCTVADVGR